MGREEYYYMESLPSVKGSDVAFEKGRVMEYLESICDKNGGILLPPKVGLFVGKSEWNCVSDIDCPALALQADAGYFLKTNKFRKFCQLSR